MKMVIVFDTKDLKGMKNAYHTIIHMAKEYMDLDRPRRVELSRIQLIKALKDFLREQNLSGEVGKSPNIKEYMNFADAIFKKYGIATVADEGSDET